MVIRMKRIHGLLSQRLISIRSILPIIHKGNITIRHILHRQRSTTDKPASCITKSPGFPGLLGVWLDIITVFKQFELFEHIEIFNISVYVVYCDHS